jgi:hypothetical protein
MGGWLSLGAIVVIGILIAIVIFFDAEFVRRFFDARRQKKLEHRTKQLIERNQNIIDAHLARIRDDAELPDDHYVLTQNCIRDIIAKVGGKTNWIVEGSAIEFPAWMPAEWQGLANYVDGLTYDKWLAAWTEQDRKRSLKQEDAFFERNRDLVSKFLEIVERKVSILDEYGEENWDALPQEIVTLMSKIAKREKVTINEKQIRASLAGDHRWVSERLTAWFVEYHDKMKARPVATLADGVSGTEFETWIARLLHAKGFEVQGTPITGDQGADLIAKKGGRVVIIQAKCYQGMVGNSAVQEVSERNLLAHGCWTDHPKHGWIVREDRGTWPNSKSGPSLGGTA